MAALNEPSSGSMKGQRGVDYSCYKQARRAGLGGTFRAFLSSRVQDLDSIVRYADKDLPVVNIKGELLFNSWKEIFAGDGGLFSQPFRIYSFNGKDILEDLTWPQKIAWHGSQMTGERSPQLYCNAWESSSPDKVGLASSLLGERLLQQLQFSCNHSFAILCIEVSSNTRRRRRSLDKLLSEPEYQQLLRQLTAVQD